jgi:hypothetical protein
MQCLKEADQYLAIALRADRSVHVRTVALPRPVKHDELEGRLQALSKPVEVASIVTDRVSAEHGHSRSSSPHGDPRARNGDDLA